MIKQIEQLSTNVNEQWTAAFLWTNINKCCNDNVG